jgi:hypothetical protein
MSKFILDTRLSDAQYVICTEAIRHGVIEPEDLNEGRRTMAEQWHFWNNQPPLAAYPSPFAPHIKAGRANHAVDANSLNGAVQVLARFYESSGVDVAFNVAGENWHMDVLSHSQVVAVAKKIRRKRDRAVLVRGESDKRVKWLKHQLHIIKIKDRQKTYYKPGADKPKAGWGNLFGEELEQAVKHFQRDHGLKSDGKVGPVTDDKIDRVYSKQKRDRKPAKQRAQERKAAYESK